MFNTKLVAIINKQIEPGVAMNALAHLSLGFGAAHTAEEVHLMNFQDAEKTIYPNISKMPYIILQAKNSNQLQTLFQHAQERGVEYTVFTETMTQGTWQDQEVRTQQTKKEQLQFYGMVLFGPKEVIAELTKKFSLWR
ncbi:MAG: DUF2000 domain-containing protein [Parachlamydiales bacterium]|jgi:hypothetical protein